MSDDAHISLRFRMLRKPTKAYAQVFLPSYDGSDVVLRPSDLESMCLAVEAVKLDSRGAEYVEVRQLVSGSRVDIRAY